MAIGIFDSGVGGINLLKRVKKALPQYDIHFYADQDHVPYGEHEPNEILEYVNSATHFLFSQGCSILLLACNTATSVAAENLRKQHIMPIVGMEPALKPAYQYIQEHDHHKKVLVTATPVTVSLPKMQNLIDNLKAKDSVDLLPMPELVRFAEKGVFTGTDVDRYFERTFQSMDLEQYGAVVLGCTHFSYFKPYFQRYFGIETAFFDGYDGTVKRLKEMIAEHPTIKPSDHPQTYFWVSGQPVLEERFSIWLT